jgi:hypothetical protein
MVDATRLQVASYPEISRPSPMVSAAGNCSTCRHSPRRIGQEAIETDLGGAAQRSAVQLPLVSELARLQLITAQFALTFAFTCAGHDRNRGPPGATQGRAASSTRPRLWP